MKSSNNAGWEWSGIMSTNDDFRKFFQEVKRMTLHQFTRKMNMMHSNAWNKCYDQHSEAMDIALQPKQRDAVREKFKMIVTEWDGLKEITLDLQSISETDFMDVVKENRRLGYARMMELISEEWKKHDPKGALSVGRSYGELAKLLDDSFKGKS